MKRLVRLILCLLPIVPAGARAATVVDIGGGRIEGEVSAVTAEHVEVIRDGKAERLPLSDVLRIRFREMPEPPACQVEVRTRHGSLLRGKLVGSEQTLGVKSSALAQAVHLKAGDILGVLLLGEEGPRLDAERFETALAGRDRDADLLFIVSPKGVVPLDVAISGIAPDNVRFSWDGKERSLETEKVAAIVFAGEAPEGDEPASARQTDGSVLRGRLVSLAGGVLTFNVEGEPVTAPVESVAAVEFANPNVTYLSGLNPVEVRETPFFNRVWEHRLDRSVGGRPISLDGRTYDRGIGCHTRTELTYDLDGRYRTFAAVIGIDDEARPRGSVTFIVRADGNELLAQTLTGRDAAEHISLEVAGVKRLVLITDFADDAHVGDHADWADARLVK